jgi:hypothetical protein
MCLTYKERLKFHKFFIKKLCFSLVLTFHLPLALDSYVMSNSSEFQDSCPCDHCLWTSKFHHQHIPIRSKCLFQHLPMHFNQDKFVTKMNTSTNLCSRDSTGWVIISVAWLSKMETDNQPLAMWFSNMHNFSSQIFESNSDI